MFSEIRRRGLTLPALERAKLESEAYRSKTIVRAATNCRSSFLTSLWNSFDKAAFGTDRDQYKPTRPGEELEAWVEAHGHKGALQEEPTSSSAYHDVLNAVEYPKWTVCSSLGTCEALLTWW